MVPGDLIGRVSAPALECWALLALWFPHDGKTPFRPPIARMAGALDKGRRAIERAIAELEKSGRLQRASGAKGGKANAYTLRFCKRSMLPTPATETPQGGAPSLTEGYDENDAGYIKVVQTTLTDHPVVLQTRSKSNSSARKNPTATHTEFSFAEFWGIYPRKTGAPAARRAWGALNLDQRRAAMEGAKVLAIIYAAASDDQRAWTPSAAKWIQAESWHDEPASLEAAFRVPGAIARHRAKQQAQAATLPPIRFTGSMPVNRDGTFRKPPAKAKP